MTETMVDQRTGSRSEEYLHRDADVDAGTRNEYISRYIFNRPTKQHLVAGSVTRLLNTTFYDNYPGTCSWHSNADLDNAPLWERQSYCRYGMPTRIVTPAETLTISRYATGVPWGTNGPNGTTTSIVDSRTRWTVPATITAQGQSSSLTWDSLLRLDMVTGPNSGSTDTDYDALNRPIKRKLPDGQETTWTYSGNATTEAVTGGTWAKYTTDGFGRMKTVQRGYGTVTESQVDYEYTPCGCSPLGKLWRYSQPYRPTVPSERVWTTYTYDILGRVTRVDHPPATAGGPGEGATIYTYGVISAAGASRETVRITSPSGRWKEYRRDGFGDLREVAEPRPDNLNVTDLTSYTYNTEGKLLAVSMSRPGYKNGAPGTYTQTRTFEYTAAGQLQRTIFPETGTTTYTYLPAPGGRIESRTDALGRKTMYEYDSYGRVKILKRYASGSGSESAPRTEYYYDGIPGTFYDGYAAPYFGFAAQYTFGRVAMMRYYGTLPDADGYSSTATVYELYSYTPGGQIRRKRLVAGASVMEVSYTYDAKGRVETMTYPSGYVARYTYNAASGRPEAVAQDGFPAAANVTWGWQGRPAGITATGQSTLWRDQYEYNLLGHPVLARHVVDQLQTWQFRCSQSKNHHQKQEMYWTFRLEGHCDLHYVRRQSVRFEFPSSVLITAELPLINPGR